MGWARERTVKRATKTKMKVEGCISARRQQEQGEGGKEGRRRDGHGTSTTPQPYVQSVHKMIGRPSRVSWLYSIVAPRLATNGTVSNVRYSTPIVVVEGGRHATRLEDNGASVNLSTPKQ